MNHRAAVHLLQMARGAWESESRAETYLAVALGTVALFIVGREAYRLRALWSDKN